MRDTRPSHVDPLDARMYLGTLAIKCEEPSSFYITCDAQNSCETTHAHADKPGVMVRTLKDLFTKVEQQSVDNEYTIRCSFLEIYNEAVRDLLDTRNEHCEVREDPSRGMAISNICEVDVKTADEILELLQRGNKRRIQEPTDANQTSSRSHAVLQVTVTQKSRTPGMTAELAVGKLSMVDLAGSERASQNNNRGMRMIEGASINRSLLALGNVINALCDKSKTSRNIFVPYRDSKLTRLLKDSLGGSCRTVMIANISPAHTQFEDTNNTLKYANRAKSIKTLSKRNVLSVNYHLEKYTHVIEQLQAEVGTLRAMLASGKQATVLQEPAATASSSRVAGIVKTLQERQRLRQALVRLDEQLRQLDHRSPNNLNGAPNNYAEFNPVSTHQFAMAFTDTTCRFAFADALSEEPYRELSGQRTGKRSSSEKFGRNP
eukprot:XP_028344100.1 kinesin-like protein KIF19 [Physeter catodon]